MRGCGPHPREPSHQRPRSDYQVRARLPGTCTRLRELGNPVRHQGPGNLPDDTPTRYTLLWLVMAANLYPVLLQPATRVRIHRCLNRMGARKGGN